MKIDRDIFEKMMYQDRKTIQEAADFFKVPKHSIYVFRYVNKLPRFHRPGYWTGKKRSPETIDKISKNRIGKMTKDKNHNWKGGRFVGYSGHVLVLHENHSGYRRYCIEHRCVMESFLKRKLKASEIVHHKNGIKTDNRIENLCVHTRSSHAKEHFPSGSKFGINSKKS